MTLITTPAERRHRLDAESRCKYCFSQSIKPRLDLLPIGNGRFKKAIEARTVVVHPQVTELVRNYVVDTLARCTNKIWIQR